MRFIVVGVLMLTWTTPALARGPVHVRGHFTKNGTYVGSHYRSAPDGSRYNNWSTRGNVNPYTGRIGTKDPYGSSYGSTAYGYHHSAPTYGYSSPSYSYTAPAYGYTVPSYGYTSPSYGYTYPGNRHAAPSYRYSPRSSGYAPRNQQPQEALAGQEGGVVLAPGVVKIPAKTASGYCLQAPADYVGTGSLNYPALSGALPRCESVQPTHDI